MLSYLVAMTRWRRFCLALAAHDIRKRYRRSVLGLAWTVLQPLLLAGAVWWVFRAALPGARDDYYLYILTGLCYWNYLTHVTHDACDCIRGAEAYILQCRVPLGVYSLRFTLSGLFHLGMALLPALVWSVAERGPPSLSEAARLAAVLTLLLVAGWSLATAFGVAAVYIADVQPIVRVALNLAFYVTPIVWRPEMVGLGRGDSLVRYNPLAAFADLLRGPLLAEPNTASAGHLLALGMVSTALFFSAAAALLAACERRLVLHL